jgi:hypothetical protein
MLTCPRCGLQDIDEGEIECRDCRLNLADRVVAVTAEGEGWPPAGGPPVASEASSPGGDAEPPDVPPLPPMPASDPVPETATAEVPVVAPDDAPPVETPPPPAVDVVRPPETAVEESLPSPRPQPAAPTETCVRCGCESDATVCGVCRASPEPTMILEVEGFDSVLYRGRSVRRIPITTDELLVGRCDPGGGIYPEIDLREFHRRQMGFVSRRHAQLFREHDRHFIVDVAGQETTEFAEKLGDDLEKLAVDSRRELKPGNRVVIGSAVTFRVLDAEGK